jgi:hypothetical protein
MSASPNNRSIAAAGDTAFYTVQLTPVPIYQSDITLSCSNLPAGASCNFSNSPAKLVSTSGVTSLLSVTTTPRPIVTPAASLLRRQFYAIWLAIPGLAFFGLGRQNGRRRRGIAMCMLGVVFALLLLIPACSHTTTQPPASGTPAGSFTITVTATSGSDVKSQAIGLSVP